MMRLSGFVTESGYEIKTTMPDIKWDLLCIVSRAYHPERYFCEEDVTETISNIRTRILGLTINELSRIELEKFISSVVEHRICENDARKNISEMVFLGGVVI